MSGLNFVFRFCVLLQIWNPDFYFMFYFWLMSRKNMWFLPHLTPCSHLRLNKNGAKETVEAHDFVAPRGFVHLQLFLWKQDSAFTGSSLSLFFLWKAGGGGVAATLRLAMICLDCLSVLTRTLNIATDSCLFQGKQLRNTSPQWSA